MVGWGSGSGAGHTFTSAFAAIGYLGWFGRRTAGILTFAFTFTFVPAFAAG